MARTRRVKGERKRSRGRVHFRTTFRISKAAYARFMRAVVNYDAQLKRTSPRGYEYPAVVTVLISLPAESRELFEEEAEVELEYDSPTTFENGSIMSIFDTPTDEVMGRSSERAAEVLAAHNHEKWGDRHAYR